MRIKLLNKTVMTVISLIFITVLLISCNAESLECSYNETKTHTEVLPEGYDAGPFEWGEIIQFSMSGGSFHEGALSYSIIMQEGEYLFSASGWNGLELEIERQPIPFEEVDALRNILKESGVEAWNGIVRQFDDDVLEADGFGFSISFKIENGSSFQASGGGWDLDDFDTIFHAISFHLADMAFRYRTEQEWGNLIHMNYSVSRGIHNSSFYIYEIYIDSNDQIRISSRVSGTWPRVDGLFDYSVMEDIREIVSNYGIDQWYGDVRFDPWNNPFISVRMRFDNGTSFSIRGNLSPSGFDEANEAILAFFRNLAE